MNMEEFLIPALGDEIHERGLQAVIRAKKWKVTGGHLLV